MNRKFTSEIIEDRETKNKKITRRVIRVKAKNNGMMSYEDVEKFYNALIKSGHDENKVAIVGVGLDKAYTLKSFRQDDINEFDGDEYYKDRAKDPQKFSNYFSCDFIIHM